MKRQVHVVAVIALLTLGFTAAGAVVSSLAPASSHRYPRHVAPPTLPAAVTAVRAELHGIPRHGLTLGSGSASVTVFEYTDLICPACAVAARKVVEAVIKRFVRLGQVDIELEPIVEGPRSEAFALGVFAAGVQGHGWDYAQLAYLRSTPQSNGPFGTPAQLAQALGLNLHRWRSALGRRQWLHAIEQGAKVALLGGFHSYPAFVVRSNPNLFGLRYIKVLPAPVSLAALVEAIRNARRFPGT